MLPGVDPELEKFTLERPLQFNPEYYRFWNEDELKKTDEELQKEKRDSLENKDKPNETIKNRPSIPFNRRTSQAVISFPVMQSEADSTNMLAPINSESSSDDEEETKGETK
jgi:hypothetical protein